MKNLTIVSKRITKNSVKASIKVGPGVVFTVQRSLFSQNSNMERGKLNIVIGAFVRGKHKFIAACARNAINLNGRPRSNARIYSYPISAIKSITAYIPLNLPKFRGKAWITDKKKLPTVSKNFVVTGQTKLLG